MKVISSVVKNLVIDFSILEQWLKIKNYRVIV